MRRGGPGMEPQPAQRTHARQPLGAVPKSRVTLLVLIPHSSTAERP
jgi:hypothetical protein